LGSWCALVTISALAVMVGDWLRRRLHERLLHGIAGSIMLILAVLACVEFARI
jgi:putative Ca2+/H+ antiporter (TMEM165/GDT1 family)